MQDRAMARVRDTPSESHAARDCPRAIHEAQLICRPLSKRDQLHQGFTLFRFAPRERDSQAQRLLLPRNADALHYREPPVEPPRNRRRQKTTIGDKLLSFPRRRPERHPPASPLPVPNLPPLLPPPPLQDPINDRQPPRTL